VVCNSGLDRAAGDTTHEGFHRCQDKINIGMDAITITGHFHAGSGCLLSRKNVSPTGDGAHAFIGKNNQGPDVIVPGGDDI